MPPRKLDILQMDQTQILVQHCIRAPLTLIQHLYYAQRHLVQNYPHLTKATPTL